MRHLAILWSLTEGFDFFFGWVFCSAAAAGGGGGFPEQSRTLKHIYLGIKSALVRDLAH